MSRHPPARHFDRPSEVPREGIERVRPNRYKVTRLNRPPQFGEKEVPKASAVAIWDRVRPQYPRRPLGAHDDRLLTVPMVTEQIFLAATNRLPLARMAKNMVSTVTVKAGTATRSVRRSPWSRLTAQYSWGQLVASATGSEGLGKVIEEAIYAHEYTGKPLPEWYQTPAEDMGCVLDGPIGKFLVGVRGGGGTATVRMVRGQVWIKRQYDGNDVITEANCEVWAAERAKTLAIRLGRTFSSIDATDPAVVSRLLWGEGVEPDATVMHIVDTFRESRKAGPFLGKDVQVVYAPCLRWSAVSPDKLLNATRLVWSIAFAATINLARLDPTIAIAQITAHLAAANIAVHRIRSMTDGARHYAQRGGVTPFRCRSRQAESICPYVQHQSNTQVQCTGGDPEATPASITIALTKQFNRLSHQPLEGTPTPPGTGTTSSRCTPPAEPGQSTPDPAQTGSRRKRQKTAAACSSSSLAARPQTALTPPPATSLGHGAAR